MNSAAGRLSIRIDLASGGRIGPGKIALLEAIARAGSISAAARSLGMSYRRAWALVEELNRDLGRPVATAAVGGPGGGGAKLTSFGEAIVVQYRAIEADSAAACRRHMVALSRAYDADN